MRNKFAGDCYRCGHRVEPGTGHFERNNGRWRVWHHDYVNAPDAVTCTMAEETYEAQVEAHYGEPQDLDVLFGPGSE